MNISQLSSKLLKSHNKTKSWNVTGKLFGITGGLAYRIAVQKYEPADQEIRKSLKLSLRPCPKCGQKIRMKSTNKKQEQPAYMQEWNHLQTDERHKAIQEYILYRTKQKTP